MHLNNLSPAKGSRKQRKRVGRGCGSGLGKTCGRGHKGLKSRSGGTVKPGFEGGQQPLQRRVPKFGFTSRKSRFVAEIRLHELSKVNDAVVDLATLKASNLIANNIRRVKVIKSGLLTKPLTIKGLTVSKGACAAIEEAGGRIEG